jgi:hypothetical protein
MKGGAGFPIWFFVMFVAFFAVAIIGGIYGSRRKRQNLSALAQRLGLDFIAKSESEAVFAGMPKPEDGVPKFKISFSKVDPGMLSPTLQMAHRRVWVAGTLRGKQVRFAEFSTSSGKSQVSWVELAVVAPARTFEFSLKRKHLGWKLVEMFVHSVTVNDPAFDERWHIQTNQPETVRAMLVPELRAKLTASDLRNIRGQFSLFGGSMRYIETGGFASKLAVAHLEGEIELVSDLADAAEVAAGEEPVSG